MSLDWTIMCTSSMIEMSHPWTIIIFKRKKDSSLSCLGPKHTNRWMGNANRCKPEPSHIEKTLFTVTRESNIYHSRQRLISIYRHMIRWALRPPENFHGPPSTKAKKGWVKSSTPNSLVLPPQSNPLIFMGPRFMLIKVFAVWLNHPKFRLLYLFSPQINGYHHPRGVFFYQP